MLNRSGDRFSRIWTQVWTRVWTRVWLVICTAVLLVLAAGDSRAATDSKYAVALRSAFNQPDFYPLSQPIDLAWYRPVAEWSGRLILPKPEEINDDRDWVWFEVQNAPSQLQPLVGKRLRLQWQLDDRRRQFLATITRDVQFSEAAIASEQNGNLHPARLNQRRVGALQSLAGARSIDDVIVSLEMVNLREAEAADPTIEIGAEPNITIGRFYGLVKILATVPAPNAAPSGAQVQDCPGQPPCPSEYKRVVHYNAATNQFDGPEEIVWIPQVALPPDRMFQSTPRDIERSPAGTEGWYIYGAKNAAGIFVVQALQPRSLMQLTPHETLSSLHQGRNYIYHQHWQRIAKGTIDRTLVNLAEPASANQAVAPEIGDRALVMHLFGGIGGNKVEPNSVPATITGHFAYGTAEVIRDPFTQELQWAIDYQQVYAHNPNGILAGRQTWAEYMGSLQRGWLATRPVSDVLIQFEPLTEDYNFDGLVFSPLRELQQQLEIMMARYRTGDGSGAALVTPALSCVQDSSQAVYRTIRSIEQQFQTTPAIQTWLKSHPRDRQTQRFRQLVQLSRSLEATLVPLGIVRPDWQQNADRLAGIAGDFVQQDSWWVNLLSWRTLLPRVAHDRLLLMFLDQGATLQFLRTNQVGGWDPDILPLAPTQLLGQYYVIPNLFARTIEALKLPNFWDLLLTLAMLALYSALALPIGFSTTFLRLLLPPLTPMQQLGLALKLIFLPALFEEWGFRVLLLPHPIEGTEPWLWLVWAAASWLLFMIYHPINALFFYRAGNPTFFSPIFLTLTGLVGLICTITYSLTGSIWTIAFLHWAIVTAWVLRLGGFADLATNAAQSRPWLRLQRSKRDRAE